MDLSGWSCLVIKPLKDAPTAEGHVSVLEPTVRASIMLISRPFFGDLSIIGKTSPPHCPFPPHVPHHSSSLFCSCWQDFSPLQSSQSAQPKKKNSHRIKTQNVFVPVFLFKDLWRAFLHYKLVLRKVCLFKKQKEKRRMQPCNNRGRDDIKELTAEEQTPHAAVFAFHIERSGNRTWSSLKD